MPQLPHRHFDFQFLTVAKGFDIGTRTATTVFTIREQRPCALARLMRPSPSDDADRSTSLHDALHCVDLTGAGTQVALVKEDDRLHLKSITVGQTHRQIIQVEEGFPPTTAS